jgi:hypothetical protein
MNSILLATAGGTKHKNRMFARLFHLICLLVLLFRAGTASAADNPFIGGWALTIPPVGAGWLGVEEVNGRLEASIMWVAGSVERTDSAKMEDKKLLMTRHHTVESKDAQGKSTKKTFTETITAVVEGDRITLICSKPGEDGPEPQVIFVAGFRQPPMPPAPDLAKIKFGSPLELFNGKDLSGWRLTDPEAVNGWSAKDGLLVNNPVQEDGKPHINYGNLRTDPEFKDFNLKLEVRLAKGGNSGVYIRGIYEVQVEDSYGQGLDSHHMGAVYSRIKPTVAAEKPAGEWQTMDITFVDRHITVVLNGQCIINNQPVAGCTGGALFSDVTRAGPLYLQGDHTGSEYRNLVLRPVEGR